MIYFEYKDVTFWFQGPVPNIMFCVRIGAQKYIRRTYFALFGALGCEHIVCLEAHGTWELRVTGRTTLLVAGATYVRQVREL